VAQKSLGKSEIMTKKSKKIKKNITNTNKYNIEPVGSKNGGPRAYPLMSLNQ
jgi:hypothetical protein